MYEFISINDTKLMHHKQYDRCYVVKNQIIPWIYYLVVLTKCR